jgi:hypothetical protein
MIERPDSKKLYKRWRSMTVAAFASWHVYTILFLAFCRRESCISAAANLTLFGMFGPSNGKLINNTNGQQARYQQTFARTLDRWKHWNFSLGKGSGAEVNDCMNSIGIRHWLTPLAPRSADFWPSWVNFSFDSRRELGVHDLERQSRCQSQQGDVVGHE